MFETRRRALASAAATGLAVSSVAMSSLLLAQPAGAAPVVPSTIGAVPASSTLDATEIAAPSIYGDDWIKYLLLLFGKADRFGWFNAEISVPEGLSSDYRLRLKGIGPDGRPIDRVVAEVTTAERGLVKAIESDGLQPNSEVEIVAEPMDLGDDGDDRTGLLVGFGLIAMVGAGAVGYGLRLPSTRA